MHEWEGRGREEVRASPNRSGTQAAVDDDDDDDDDNCWPSHSCGAEQVSMWLVVPVPVLVSGRCCIYCIIAACYYYYHLWLCL